MPTRRHEQPSGPRPAAEAPGCHAPTGLRAGCQPEPDQPTCATGPAGRASWVVRELIAIVRDRRARRQAEDAGHDRSLEVDIACEGSDKTAPGPPPAGRTVPDVPDRPADLLEARLAGIDRRMLDATAGRSLCQVSRDGAPPAVKELEGRLAALSEVRRRGLAARHDVLQEWEAHQQEASVRGPAWRAYRAGGVDELHAVIAALGDVAAVTFDRGAQLGDEVTL